ncbi:MAG: pirin family protein, partial [Pseudobdellovibrionaceae bacterium]
LSAGTGIAHSEYNQKLNEETHFFQIWIMPQTSGGTPSYGQKSFENELNSQKMVLVVSEDSREGSIGIKQDADLYISRLKKNEDFQFQLRSQRGAWIQVVKGQIDVNGKKLSQGDAISFENAELLSLKAFESSEFLLFDLA